MTETTSLQKLTLQEFLDMPAGDITYEFEDGQLIPKMSPKYFHANITFALVSLLRQWCVGKGRACGEWTVVLSEDWSPTPDVVYISYDRLPRAWNKNEACPVAPELAMEILSPGQTLKELEAKASNYISYGVLRVWIVDPASRKITACYPDRQSQAYIGSVGIVDPVLEGLEITPAQVFALAELPD